MGSEGSDEAVLSRGPLVHPRACPAPQVEQQQRRVEERDQRTHAAREAAEAEQGDVRADLAKEAAAAVPQLRQQPDVERRGERSADGEVGRAPPERRPEDASSKQEKSDGRELAVIASTRATTASAPKMPSSRPQPSKRRRKMLEASV